MAVVAWPWRAGRAAAHQQRARPAGHSGSHGHLWGPKPVAQLWVPDEFSSMIGKIIDDTEDEVEKLARAFLPQVAEESEEDGKKRLENAKRTIRSGKRAVW